MARYIDADKIPFNRANEGETTIKYAYKSDIDSVPTADVRPERRGYWIPIFENAADEKRGVAMKYKCSECGNTAKDETYSHAMDYEFCPRCGAKMDGKDGESDERA